MTIFTHPDDRGHEGVFFHHDPETGLRCIIAVHSTARGPATGGCRMWPYESEDEAIRDVLRLSFGMSYKNAISDLALGGGKSVIIGDPRTDKTPALFQAFGRFINRLSGLYITAEDVGITPEDLQEAAKETRFVAGLDEGATPSGDPSPFTAYGVYLALRKMVEIRLGKTDLRGVRVAVQGVGHVGLRLAERLAEDGAALVVTDMNKVAVEDAVARLGARAVALEEIYDQDVDVFAPCALGGIINKATAGRLKAKVIAGAANNQLSEPGIGQLLQDRNIAYAPDYIVNCGGIINVEGEVYGSYDPEAVKAKIRATVGRLGEIVEEAARRRVPTNLVADETAERMLRTKPSHLRPTRAAPAAFSVVTPEPLAARA